MLRTFAVVAVSASLACCQTAPAAAPARDGAAADAGEAAAEAVALRQAAGAGQDYKIAPADLVSVAVYDNAEMNRKARVSADGLITLPLAGAVKIGGKTPAAAEALIEAKLSTYVVHPQVSLFIEEYGNKTFFVLGEVQKPGSYPLPTEARMTVLEAISTAGGFTPVAAQDRARVLRSVDGRSRSYAVDVRAITGSGRKEQDMVLEPNDVVYVPQSLF